MKITKSELKGLIKEELLEVFGLEIPIGKKETAAPQPGDVLNNIREMWPSQDSGDREKIEALEDIYRFLDKALVGTAAQPGLMKLKEELDVERTSEDLLVLRLPGSDARSVLNKEQAIDLARKIIEAFPNENY